jgi:hypothetical protein
VVHNSAAGLLSSSLIVDADITAATITNDKLAQISSANIAGDIVVRDGSGNFAGNTITATTFVGNVTGGASLDLPLTGGTLTGTLTIPAGNPGVPSLQFTGSANTGISASVLDTLSFDANGIEIMNVGPSGLTVNANIIANDNINLLNSTSSSVGNIVKGGATFLHNFGTSNIFLGTSTGNFTLSSAQNNVGIGRLALTALTTGSNNLIMGVLAGIALTTGSTNCAFGYESLAALTVGSSNTAIGAFALENLGTSPANTNNTAIGASAGQNLTSGSSNIYIGTGAGSANESNTIRIGTGGTQSANFQAGVNAALVANPTQTSAVSIDSAGQLNVGTIYNNIDQANTTASQGALTKNGGTLFLHNFGTGNTFLGASAGNRTMTGTQNVGVGGSVMPTLTNGSNNTAVGYVAGGALTTGIENTVVGAGALQLLTTGNANVAVGYQALTAAVGGGLNVAIGNMALNALSGGNFNVAIGSGAGTGITSGGDNLILGTNAGTAVTTGSNNIYIGHPGAASESGIMRIGNSITANYQAGIYNVTTSGGVGVLINSAGQLGTSTSSKKFKEDIMPVSEEIADALLQLEPVSFRYKNDDTREQQYGFVAEDVIQKIPELVICDDDNNPHTVRYHVLYALLLDRIKRDHVKMNVLEETISSMKNYYDSVIEELAVRVLTLEQAQAAA